jgi:hypothetical protein
VPKTGSRDSHRRHRWHEHAWIQHIVCEFFLRGSTSNRTDTCNQTLPLGFPHLVENSANDYRSHIVNIDVFRLACSEEGYYHSILIKYFYLMILENEVIGL